jgi:hypothetical protein
MVNKIREPRVHTSNCVAYSEIPYENEWTKGTDGYSWPFRNIVSTKKESQRDCLLFSKFRDLCDENHELRVEVRILELLASVDDDPLGK